MLGIKKPKVLSVESNQHTSNLICLFHVHVKCWGLKIITRGFQNLLLILETGLNKLKTQEEQGSWWDFMPFDFSFGMLLIRSFHWLKKGHVTKDNTKDRGAYSCHRWKGEIPQITKQWANDSHSVQRSVLERTNYFFPSLVRYFNGSNSSFK